MILLYMKIKHNRFPSFVNNTKLIKKHSYGTVVCTLLVIIEDKIFHFHLVTNTDLHYLSGFFKYFIGIYTSYTFNTLHFGTW
jgi:hypothetical protein